MAARTSQRVKNDSGSPKGQPAAFNPILEDPTLERSVLGAIILDNGLYYEAVAAGLSTEDFTGEANRRIFGAIGALVAGDHPADLVTLVQQLERTYGDVKAAVGGAAYVSDLTTGAVVQNLADHVEVLREKRLRRQAVQLAERLSLMALDMAEPIKFTLNGVAEDALAASGRAQDKTGDLVKAYSGQVMAQIEERMLSGRELVGLPFGIQKLDELTTGIRESELVVTAGSTGSGKTGFVTTVLLHNAQQGTPVAFFSVEMPREDVITRMLASLSGISHSRLRAPVHLHSQDLRELKAWREKFDQLPIVIDDDNTISLVDLEARARLYIAKFGVRLIAVDYVQIVSTPDEKEYDRVTRVANGLMHLARATKVPVIALSQLSRPDGKKEPRNVIPTLAQLRSSGQVEQNANIVLFTFHPIEENSQQESGEDLIVIGKQRAGVTGRIPAYYNPRSLKWEYRETQAPSPQQGKFKLGGNGKQRELEAVPLPQEEEF